MAEVNSNNTSLTPFTSTSEQKLIIARNIKTRKFNCIPQMVQQKVKTSFGKVISPRLRL